jgi:hypothetical protein
MIVGLAAVVVLVLIRAMLPGGVFAQQVGWPTPPPGPQFPLPSEQQLQATVSRSVEADGAIVLTVAPSWPGPVPLIPPIPSTPLVFNDAAWNSLPLTVEVDAGTFSRLVQVRVTQVETGDLPPVPGQVQLAWRIEVFDADGDRWSAPVQRPLYVSIPVAALVGGGIQGDHLLFWLATDGDAPVPQVTELDSAGLTVSTRLVSVGVLVLADET